MRLKWLPWRFFVTRIARAYGFLDPIQFLAKLRTFAQPSEVTEPVELLRAGVLFHARGLINTKAIQHNLDWIWPYWVERQFNPGDLSFIPRAFSFSHINLTHRNWTATGLPNVPYYPIVDPRGLVTPVFDGWSLDFWLFGPEGRALFPSKLDDIKQTMAVDGHLKITTEARDENGAIQSQVTMEMAGQRPHCVIRVTTESLENSFLAAVIRPYNPEGISFIESIRVSAEDPSLWWVNEKEKVHFNRPPAKSLFSTYKKGDVVHSLPDGMGSRSVRCPVSMASGAALFPLPQTDPIEVHIPILDELESGRRKKPVYGGVPTWEQERETCSRMEIPNQRWRELYDQSVATLILHAPGDVYPGPYTYKRFWYRDAAFILNGLLTLGAVERTEKALDRFPQRQTRTGYFLSQEGEWDSNGEALWIWDRFCQLSGRTPSREWLEATRKGANWISRKRLPKQTEDVHGGLLPAGFSAEHLGPNDYYYWDNFWAVAGLKAAARMIRPSDDTQAKNWDNEAAEYFETIVHSFAKTPETRHRGAIPASPHRRMDSGAVGSIVADYPLQLFPPGDMRIMKTVHYLMDHSFYRGGFFQNMIHSGINVYLTLQLAQILLRAGDTRAFPLIDAVAGLATSTGQWPEAIHPNTLGGCMGDGQHVWAAAEWALMMRHLFVREEPDRLILGAGLNEEWLRSGQPLVFGPTLTPHGPVTVRVLPEEAGEWALWLEADWRGHPPKIEIAVKNAEVRLPRTREDPYRLSIKR